jgi:asparagine synthase (glutamine-hydrolysing)
MVSDVPIGAFLSGGIDSSLIVALMKEHAQGNVRTFTIGFEDLRFNEAVHAANVARHLGTEHTELYITSQDARNVIPDLPQIYDEPFADSSQIPTTLVSRMTRQHVTVALSGDGGDEVFAGYPRYWLSEKLWRKMNGVPRPLRSVLSALLRAASPAAWDNVLGSVLSAERIQNLNGRRLHRLAQLLETGTLEELYTRLTSQWVPNEGLVFGLGETIPLTSPWPVGGRDEIEAIRLRDMQYYLCDDLLVKVDRAAMSASLETRAPLLNHNVVELALSLPPHALIRDGVGKWVLRQMLDHYVPRSLIDRPKAGFAVPLGAWLSGPLLEWAESLLSPRVLKDQGYLDPTMVTAMWAEHKSGKFDRSTYLWNVLMFQLWLEQSDCFHG